MLTMGTLGPSHRGWPLLLTGLEKMTLNDPASGFVYVTSPLISEASALPGIELGSLGEAVEEVP